MYHGGQPTAATPSTALHSTCHGSHHPVSSALLSPLPSLSPLFPPVRSAIGNHYDRTAAGGLATKYADGVNFHSDGLPNEPKKSHLMRLHQAIATVSANVLSFPAQYQSNISLPWRSGPSEPWQKGTQQVAFVYGGTVFIESTAAVYVQALYEGMALDLASNSILIFYRGNVLYNTSAVAPATVQRVNTPVWDAPLAWEAWAETPYSLADEDRLGMGIPTVKAMTPQEQLNVTRDLTDYCTYTTRQLWKGEANATLSVDSGIANSFLVFLDGAYQGSCYNADHGWTTTKWQCQVVLGAVTVGSHTLSLVSVSLGIENGMNPEEVPYEAHYKGIQTSGSVKTAANDLSQGVWVHRPYLTGEWLALFTAEGRGSVQWQGQWQGLIGQPLVWWSAPMPPLLLPTSGQWSLLIDLTGMGRGHVYINGHDAGHYWLIAGKGSQYPTQWLYHIPQDWLIEGGPNRVTLIEELGGDPTRVKFVVSQMLPKGEGVEGSEVERRQSVDME